MNTAELFTPWEITWTGLVAGLIAAAILFYYPWGRVRWRFVLTGVATTAGWIGWNFVLRQTGAGALTPDGPFDLSWQDVGSAVTAFTAVSLALGIREHRQPAGTVVAAAFTVAMTTLIWDRFVL